MRGCDKNIEMPARRSLGVGGEGEMYLRYIETEASLFLANHKQRRQGGN